MVGNRKGMDASSPVIPRFVPCPKSIQVSLRFIGQMCALQLLLRAMCHSEYDWTVLVLVSITRKMQRDGDSLYVI